MEFSLFRRICELLLSEANDEYVFAHTVMILCWNLMCRAESATSIRWSDLELKDDALAVRLAHNGERGPWHVYANPVMPEVCPILSLGIYLLSVPIDPTSVNVFPGGNQQDRFQRILDRVLSSEQGQAELDRRRLSSDAIDAEAMRSGAADFAEVTCIPSPAAVHLRAGRPFVGAQALMFHYNAEGDMCLGRIAAGISPAYEEFLLLPPMFEPRSPLVDRAVESCFPRLAAASRRLGEHVLASVVFHSDYLRRTLPADHALFTSTLFSDAVLLADLKAAVVCRASKPGDAIAATGIPPYILTTLQGLRQIEKQVLAMADDLVKRVADVIEEHTRRVAEHTRPVTENTRPVTLHDFRTILTECLQEVMPRIDLQRLANITAALEQRRPVAAEPAAAPSTEPPLPPPVCIPVTTHTWGDKLHLVPADFELPRGSTRALWRNWCCGDPARGYLPFRFLKSYDMPTVNVRRQLNKLSFLMKRLEGAARADGVWSESPTASEADEMFERYKGSVMIESDQEQAGRKRRAEEVEWSRMVGIVKKQIRLAGSVE